MYERNGMGQTEPTRATPLQGSLPGTHNASGFSAYQSTLNASMHAALPAGRRATPSRPTMGAVDNGLQAFQDAVRRRTVALGRIFQLPTTLQGYLLFTFCLLILAFTMVLHVTLSAEILRLSERLDGLTQQYESTERQNAGIIYEISRYSSLQDVYAKAVAAGYVPADARQYVVERPDVVAALDNPAPANEAPQYLVLGGSQPAPDVQAQPAVVTAQTTGESSAESGFWSYFRWQRVRDAWAETGSWLRGKLPAWGQP